MKDTIVSEIQNLLVKCEDLVLLDLVLKLLQKCREAQ